MLPKEEIQSRIGKPLQEFIHKKYKNQKYAAKDLRISPAFLSLIIKGDRLVPPTLQEKLKNIGFDTTVFDYYYLKPEEVEKTVYTFDEFSYIVRHLRQIINDKDRIIEQLNNSIRNLRISWEHDITIYREKLKLVQQKSQENKS